MARVKLVDRVLPTYTRGEEIFNMVSHIIGGAFGIIALILCVAFSVYHQNIFAIAGSAIYGGTMILLYSMSSIYHGLGPNLMAKRVFQVIDHCSIYLLIAGTYTPIALCALRNYDARLGWIIFGVVWTIAILGIVLNAIDLKKYRVFSMICYLGMGWCIIFAIQPISAALTLGGTMYLLLGGVAYTIGAILYGIGKKKKYMHSIFHLFVLIGSIMHFFCIFFYVI